MEFWIIKHVPTGGYLPAGQGRNGRGFTHQEVVPPLGPWAPRLFDSQASAKTALTWWLRGITTVTYTQHGSSLWDDIDPSEDWHTEPQAHRRAEEMAIVRVRLTEVTE